MARKPRQGLFLSYINTEVGTDEIPLLIQSHTCMVVHVRMLAHLNVYILEVKYVTYIWTLCNEIGSFVFKRGTFFIKREKYMENCNILSIQLHATPVTAN
jgi:hypothetical protein